MDSSIRGSPLGMSTTIIPGWTPSGIRYIYDQITPLASATLVPDTATWATFFSHLIAGHPVSRLSVLLRDAGNPRLDNLEADAILGPISAIRSGRRP